MPDYNDYIFVLWGNGFEEATASIFVSELREVGLWVKIVGLTAQRISGAHGLALVPDLTLEQALPLAPHTACLIIPYSSRGITRLKNEPRLRYFCHHAYANKAKLIIGQINDADLAEFDLVPGIRFDVMIYPDNEKLVTFAREIAGLLLRYH